MRGSNAAAQVKSEARQVARPLRIKVDLAVKVSEDTERESAELYPRTASESETVQECCVLILLKRNPALCEK
jgi:hypothetical protein